MEKKNLPQWYRSRNLNIFLKSTLGFYIQISINRRGYPSQSLFSQVSLVALRLFQLTHSPVFS